MKNLPPQYPQTQCLTKNLEENTKNFVRVSKIIRTFASDMRTKTEIEKQVCDYFKVDLEDLYKKGKYTYPYDGARSALMWLLYSNGTKSYVLSEMFGITDRQVQIVCARACVALKSDTKFKEYIERINQQLNS